ncbi:c-type cytochrome [Polyangium aurulentum]|uniref:c-type cytochrome n=1 Tax=Polyangium aurulentum TaxID=2567896 RepID=UPI00146BCF67|nr:c-type cytochrome [Polyangium aurulentum]UQA56122.1 c-type cytochrome [Polyangium aurulentum]
MRVFSKRPGWILGASLLLAGAASVRAIASPKDDVLRALHDASVRHSTDIHFPNRVGALGDPVAGQAKFGIAADGESPDDSQAIFEGQSSIAGTVVSNGRTCFSCHRPYERLGLPPPPLTDTIPLTDVLFTGLEADTGDEPLGFVNFNQLGLLFHRPGRFNPLLPPESPFRRVFFWRKSTPILNTVFTFGNLGDGRMRELTETARGAFMVHTQNGDLRFDDLLPLQDLRDVAAFMESQIDPPELAALLDPSDPLHDTLVDDPFHTVQATTPAEKRGQKLFAQNCMSCHDMPNVFSNRAHVNGPPLLFPPAYGHVMDIGVSQRNKHGLEFRRYDAGTGQRVPVVIPLVKIDGTIVPWTVTDDIGAAATTARYEDLHRFKVPQLRRVSELGPYFHDHSAATLEEVVDYFTSDWYNQSPDGRKHPIHLNAKQKADLVAFLKIL